jgi:hypothetical protein
VIAVGNFKPPNVRFVLAHYWLPLRRLNESFHFVCLIDAHLRSSVRPNKFIAPVFVQTFDVLHKVMSFTSLENLETTLLNHFH